VGPTADISNYIILNALAGGSARSVVQFITSRNFLRHPLRCAHRRYLATEVSLDKLVTLQSHPFSKEGMRVKSNTVILQVTKRSPVEATVRWRHQMNWKQPLGVGPFSAVSRKSLADGDNWTGVLFPSSALDAALDRCRARIGTTVAHRWDQIRRYRGCFSGTRLGY